MVNTIPPDKEIDYAVGITGTQSYITIDGNVKSISENCIYFNGAWAQGEIYVRPGDIIEYVVPSSKGHFPDHEDDQIKDSWDGFTIEGYYYTPIDQEEKTDQVWIDYSYGITG